ncbi:flagellar basal body-associated FliL family protein [Pseudomonadota bacterium]
MRLFSLLIVIASLIFSGYAFAEEEEKEGEEAKKEVAYYSLRPDLVANIKGKRSKFARCAIQLMTTQKERIEDIELHTPALRHALLLLLSEQTGKTLKTQEGKEKFRQEALAAVQGVIEEQTGAPIVENLFFTSFFVQ